MNKFLAGSVLALVCLAATSRVNAGPKWDISEDSYLSASFLGQVQASYLEDELGQPDFYLRRARIILSGQVMDGVKFFVETDNDNAGRHGTSDVSTDIQDAFVDLQILGSDHWLQTGLILLPFSFEDHSSAASLLGIDYNAEAIKFVNTFVWRDYGAALHGSFGDRFAYNVGVFDGYDDAKNTKNPDADLRLTGHIAFNVVGAVETGWFNTQDRQGSKGNYLSIGAGVDRQGNATKTPVVTAGAVADPAVPPATVIADSDAWVVDFQSGFGIGPTVLTVNGAYYDWDNAAFKGNTAFVESGLMLKKTMLTAKCSLQDPDSGSKTTDYTVGLHYFMKNHNMRGGVEYRWGDSADLTLAGVQFLL